MITYFRKLALSKHASALIALVFLFNLLIPTIAAATVKSDQYGAVFNAICTTAGLKVVGAEGSATHSSAQNNGVHCPLCVLGNAPPLLGQPPALISEFSQRYLVSWVFVDTLWQAVFWLSASPRAPPNGMISG
jgi:Protein of unknown function (DUF2946)